MRFAGDGEQKAVFEILCCLSLPGQARYVSAS